MKPTMRFGHLYLTLIASASCLTAAPLDTNRIDQLTGLKGAWIAAEGVFKVTAPRTDLKVTVDGWTMPPFMGLTSWAAFTAGKAEEATVMGDLVLFQDEVNPVMSAALSSGLSVTALHNHFFYDEPKVYFMHIGGEGETAKLAAGVKAALEAQKAVRTSAREPARTFGKPLVVANSISAAPLEAVLAGKPAVKDGMVKFVFGRKGRMPCGCEAGKEMGVNTWAAFAGTDDQALVAGDFCVLATELQPVLRTLRTEGINIVAIHQHMTMEEPRYIFLHYWGRGPAGKLATSLKKALALQDAKP